MIDGSAQLAVRYPIEGFWINAYSCGFLCPFKSYFTGYEFDMVAMSAGLEQRDPRNLTILSVFSCPGCTPKKVKKEEASSLS